MSSDLTLGDEIAALAAQLEAGEYRLITKIGEFDAQGGYAREGALSCAHWLSYRVGLGLGPAREKVRVARVLPKFPLIAKAFEAAQVSYSKVRAITRVATPENEALLVDMATSAPASVLETFCRRFRGVLDAERETPEEADERRKVVVHHTDGGRLRLSVELDADEGARLLAALDLARFDVPSETPRTFEVSAETPHTIEVSAETPPTSDVPAESPRTFDVSAKAPRTRADALMVLVESFLAEGARSRKGGTPTEVRLHVSEDELHSGGGFIENAGCVGVSAETSRRLSCDATVVEVACDAAGRILRTGRRTRSVPTGMRRALEIRDQHRCAFPSCTHMRFLDAHHIEHWADGGATELDNLVLLCRRHHTFVHEHGYRIERTAVGTQFIAPGKRPLPAQPPLPESPSEPIERLAEVHAGLGLSLGAPSLMPQNWDGARADHAWIVGAMCQQTFGAGRSMTGVQHRHDV